MSPLILFYLVTCKIDNRWCLVDKTKKTKNRAEPKGRRTQESRYNNISDNASNLFIEE